jgi:hypothetical protein
MFIRIFIVGGKWLLLNSRDWQQVACSLPLLLHHCCEEGQACKA